MTNRKMRYCWLALIALLGMSCSGKGDHVKDLSYKEKVKLEQYMVTGERLYIAHCSNCHQENGQGLAKLFPPLNKADYVDNNVEQVVCIMKNGLTGEIVVNGTPYNQPMPPMPQLTDLEIAEIATYIYNSWDRSEGTIEVNKVKKMLDSCQQVGDESAGR